MIAARPEHLGAQLGQLVAKEIKRLEKQMLDHAKNLEFEKAAQVRDQLAKLRAQVFGASGDHIL